MKPHHHANASAKKFGGHCQDYMEIHSFIDSSKAAYADVRHRAVLHSAFGIFICEKVFGYSITNAEGIEVPVRDIAEQHILMDCGTIPTVQDWLEELPMKPFMSGIKSKRIMNLD